MNVLWDQTGTAHELNNSTYNHDEDKCTLYYKSTGNINYFLPFLLFGYFFHLNLYTRPFLFYPAFILTACYVTLHYKDYRTFTHSPIS